MKNLHSGNLGGMRSVLCLEEGKAVNGKKLTRLVSLLWDSFSGEIKRISLES
jgi:hypothetical protein